MKGSRVMMTTGHCLSGLPIAQRYMSPRLSRSAMTMQLQSNRVLPSSQDVAAGLKSLDFPYLQCASASNGRGAHPGSGLSDSCDASWSQDRPLVATQAQAQLELFALTHSNIHKILWVNIAIVYSLISSRELME